MSDKPNQLAVAMPPAMLAVAALSGLAPEYIIQTVKAQCFKGAATDAQVDAFISIACEMKVNPLLPGMLYAYPISGGGIVPIMGPSGVYKKLAEHPEVDSWETTVFPEDVALAPTHAITKIFRKGRERPLEYTALMSEWKIDTNQNWVRRPRHMLALRSLKHCANQIIHGIPYDEDDRVIMGAIDVTPGEDQPKVDRPAPPKRAARGAAAVAENPTPATSKGTVIDAETTPVTEASKTTVSAPLPPNGGSGGTQAPKAATRDEDLATVGPEGSAGAEIKPLTRAFLKDKEEITAVCEIAKVDPMIITSGGVPTPSCQVQLKGGYEGIAYHLGGASKSGDVVIPLPVWVVGAGVTVRLRGRLNTNPKAAGKVQVFVDEVKAEEGAMEV